MSFADDLNLPGDWARDALCAQVDPELFYPEKGASTREAKRVCMACEVRAECLEYALANDERFGIWGGLSEQERMCIARQRKKNAKAAPTAAPELTVRQREILRLRRAGLSNGDIAARLDIDPDAVGDITAALRRAGHDLSALREPRTTAACGTTAGRRAHAHRNERACRACLDADKTHRAQKEAAA